jgi:hypothetical protein
MYKVATCHPSAYVVSGSLFPRFSGGRLALPVPSPAAISLLLTSLVTTPGPLVGPSRPIEIEIEIEIEIVHNMCWQT